MAAAPSTSSEFLDLICKSGLLTEDRLNELGELPEEPTQCASALIAKGVITKFQAKLLLGGRYKGFKLGAYFIREQIGQGGMGAVYLAEHETLRRKVALKVLTLPKDGNNALSIERFLREARSAAALDHPNIVRLHDIGKHADTHFLVMEYVEGLTLEQITAKNGPISSSRAVEYIAQAAAGLQHACEKGFIHRDIKPGNLMLTREGVIKILDMGLARPTDDSKDKLTEVMDNGAIVGTADFLSPEQAMNGKLDVRSDIYSLGATFFALVTGAPPFSGNTTQKLIQHQMKEAPSVATIDKTFPAGLSAVVAKMLAKKPEQRYQNPAEVITALAEWLPQQASARISAAISGTDLANSAEMQTTLSEVASGTKRIGSKPRINNGPKTASKWFWPGLVAGVLVLAGGTTAALSMNLQEPEPEVAQIPAEPPKAAPPPKKYEPKRAPTPAPKAEPKPQPMVPVSVAPHAGDSLLDKLELESIPPFSERGRSTGTLNKIWKSEEKTGNGAMPAGWNVATHGIGCIAEVALKSVDGLNALGFHAVEGPNSMMIQTPKFESPTGKVTISFDYMMESPDTGLSLRFVQHIPSKKSAIDLVPTFTGKPGEWKNFSRQLDLKGGSGGLIEFHPRNGGRGFIWIRNVFISKAGNATDKPSRDVPLFSQNFKNFKPASMRIDNATRTMQLREIDGVALPTSISINQHRPNVTSEYAIADVQGVRALGFKLIEGETGVQVQTTCGEAISLAKPGESLRFKITYRHDGTHNGGAAIQLAKGPSFTKFQLTPLVPTNGAWNTIEIIFVRPHDMEKYELILNAGATTETRKHAEGMIYVQSIEVTYADAK